MHKTNFKIKYKINFFGPLSINSGFATINTNNSMVKIKDHSDKLPEMVLIPGTTIKGRIKYHMEKLLGTDAVNKNQTVYYCRDMEKPGSDCLSDGNNACPLCVFFGNTSRPTRFRYNKADLDREIANKFKDDIDGRLAEKLNQTRPHVAIDKKYGTSLKHHLFFSQCSLPGLTFNSSIEGSINKETEAAIKDLSLLICAMKEVDFIGSSKSSGIGRCGLEIECITVNGEKAVDINEIINKL